MRNSLRNCLRNCLQGTALASLLMLAVPVLVPGAQANDELPPVPTSVNVNIADAPTIASILQGVGLARAQAIVEYREANGAFSDLESLRKVKGVGEVTLEANNEKIRFKD